MTAIGGAILLAVAVMDADAALLCPLAVGRVAGEPGVSGGVMCGRFLSPILPLSLECGCSVSSLWVSAASSFPPVS